MLLVLRIIILIKRRRKDWLFLILFIYQLNFNEVWKRMLYIIG